MQFVFNITAFARNATHILGVLGPLLRDEMCPPIKKRVLLYTQLICPMRALFGGPLPAPTTRSRRSTNQTSNRSTSYPQGHNFVCSRKPSNKDVQALSQERNPLAQAQSPFYGFVL